MKKIYDKPNWVIDTKKTLKKYTDRPIIVHNKFSKKNLDELLKDAWAFVSLQSTAGFKAMAKGVPAYFTDQSLKNVAKINDIENPKIDYKIFNNLAYGQWTLKEIGSGEAWECILKQI
jgi:capsule polysaccharide modification protein KpsS